MKISRTQALDFRIARPARGVLRLVGLTVALFVTDFGCSGCYQSNVVPPTTSIPSPIRPVPGPSVPFPADPVIPPTTRPEEPLPALPSIDPVTTNNRWKPDAESRDWNYIVLHHTASETGSVETIHEEHLKRKDKNGNHWLGIGYHFVIGNGSGMGDGVIEPTFRWRQQIQGAHAGIADYNQHGIGIVLIGNFEKSPPTDAQTASVKQLVGVMKREYGIASNRVVGHNDVKATECPGKLFPMSDVQGSIALRDENAAIPSDFPDVVSLIYLPGDLRK